jgi:hypothetical protein
VLIGLIIALFLASFALIAARIHEANSAPPPKIVRPKRQSSPAKKTTNTAKRQGATSAQRL